MFKPGDVVEYVKYFPSEDGLLPPESVGIVKGQRVAGNNYYDVLFWCLPSITLNMWHKNLRLVKGDQNV